MICIGDSGSGNKRPDTVVEGLQTFLAGECIADVSLPDSLLACACFSGHNWTKRQHVHVSWGFGILEW